MRILFTGIFLLSGLAGAADLRPYSVQLHLHGSMSEGPGSMRGANVQARKLGLDVLWWTDHDWRVAYHTYLDGYDFESPHAPQQGVTITITPHAANGKVTDTVARLSAERAVEGQRSLEVGAAADASRGFQAFFQEAGATRARLKRSLASGVEVDISIYPEIEVDKKTMVGVRFDLSQQPPAMERGAIIYVLTGLTDSELEALSTASTKFVRLGFKLHQWNKYTLKLTEDARRLGLGGVDNALGAASFGVLTAGQRARAFFDGYHIRHEIGGEELLRAARRMTAEFEKEYGVTNYVGQEFSYMAHLNAFGDVPMLDYAKKPEGYTAAEAAEFTHRHGGVISLNHYLGGKGDGVRKRIAELIASGGFAADLLECNPGQLANFLAGWDAAAKAGIRMTGDGVSDSHSSTGGWFTGSNFVTWVWARSKSPADLLDGLRRGEAYFGNPAKYRGEVTLSTPDGHRMGQAVITRKPAHRVTARITNLPASARVRTVVNGEYLKDATAGGGTWENAIDVNTSAATFVRVEAWSPDGGPLVFSNPIYFVPGPDGVGPARRADCR